VHGSVPAGSLPVLGGGWPAIVAVVVVDVGVVDDGGVVIDGGAVAPVVLVHAAVIHVARGQESPVVPGEIHVNVDIHPWP
jgi:hypothetical protein